MPCVYATEINPAITQLLHPVEPSAFYPTTSPDQHPPRNYPLLFPCAGFYCLNSQPSRFSEDATMVDSFYLQIPF